MPDLIPVKILVVDDLPEKHVVYRALLEEPGHELVSAMSGEDALKQLLQSEFAVILLDINMPGMDGFETASIIRARKASAHTPIIFITAFPDEVFALKGYSLGAVDYILAPVAPNILRTKVGVFVQLFRLTQQVKKQAAQQIAAAQAERARLTAILDNAADFVARVDARGKPLVINRGGLRMLGWEPDTSLAKNLLSPYDQATLTEALVRANRDGVYFGEAVFRGRDNRAIPVSQFILAHKDDAGVVDSYSIIARDIRERKRAEETTARLAAIIESSEDAIVSKDLNGIITSWNHGAERLFGYSAEEIVGKPIALLIPSDRRDEEQMILQRIRGGEAIEHYETVRRRKDGAMLDISLTVSPLRDATGRVIGASKIARDITRQKKGEEEIRSLAAERARLLDSERSARSEAERLGRLKDEFLATLLHELRTPLNAILGWAKLLRGSDTTAEDIAEGLDVIDRNARVQAQLVEELLDMNRIISGKLQLNTAEVDVGKIVAEALESVRLSAQAKAISVSFDAPGDCLTAVADGNRIQQIVWNLLSNAIKFTPKGGNVRVDLSCDDESITLRVRDSGEGIPAEFMPFLFDRFRQADAGSARRHGGLGLGLAIVRQLVDLHGGSVTAESDGKGAGATFTVTLPRRIAHSPGEALPQRPKPAPTEEALAPLDRRQLSGLRIVVVDDEPDAVYLARRVLEDFSAEVIVACSAAEGFDQVRRERPHVLISDIGMPLEDGYSLMQRIRAEQNGEGPPLIAIALTAFARPEDRARALDAGYQAHISKPVDPHELVRTVADLAHGLLQPNDPQSTSEPARTPSRKRPSSDRSNREKKAVHLEGT